MWSRLLGRGDTVTQGLLLAEKMGTGHDDDEDNDDDEGESI